ncbi:MAG TPA: peptidylprolyl isomerase [Bacteroidetes bacterium]|nr:peptidylprolyl isomerase [Candidatus Limimorpha avicola]
MKRISVTVLMALFMLPALVFGQSYKSKTLLTLGDKEFTADEFMAVYEKNNVRSDVIDKKTVDEYMDLFINFKLKVTEAENLKMDTSAKFIRELNGYRQQLAKPYFSNDEVTEKIVEEAYERMKYDLNADHILVKCDLHAVPSDTLKAYNKALELRKRILAGEDFGDVAVEASDDLSARDIEPVPGQHNGMKGNRGNLGYFTVFDMVYPFESGAYNTPVGEISMPVRSDFGYHLIKVNSKTPASGVIRAAHIFLIVDENDPDRQDSVVKAKIDNIYKELEPDGSNWSNTVRKYTDDKGTIKNDGMLSPFRVSNLVPEFIDAVKSLEPEQFSKPVKTKYGYHIVKLIGTSGVGDFETEKDRLKERVGKDMRASFSEEVVLKRIMKENKFKEMADVKDNFINSIDSTLSLGVYKMSENVNKDEVLFSINQQKYTIGDFVDYIYKHQEPQPFISAASFAYQLYDAFVKEKVFEYEDAHLEDKYPEFNTLIQEYHDGILLFDLMEQQVWRKAIEDTVSLQNYFEQHKDEYMWGDRVKAMVVTLNRPDNLEKVKELVTEENDIDNLRKRIKEDSIRYVNARCNFYQKGDNINIDEMEWTVGNILVIPSTVDKSTEIIKILEVRAPEHKTLKEAKGLVTSAYQEELEKQWVEELKVKYPVNINNKLLKKIKKYYGQK